MKRPALVFVALGVASAAVLLTVFQRQQASRAPDAPPARIRVTVLYPQTSESRFDMTYYLGTHIPLVRARLAPALRGVLVEQGLSGREPGSPAPFAAICHLSFDSLEAYREAFGPHAAEIAGDLPNFTNIQPTLQISEVRF